MNIDWNSVNADLNSYSDKVLLVSGGLEDLAEVLKDRTDTSEWLEIAKDLQVVCEKIKELRNEEQLRLKWLKEA